MGVIYKLTFPSGKSYIGLTVRPLMVRISQHRTQAKKGDSRSFLVHRAWTKHGEPKVEVLFEGEGEELRQAERDAIKAYGTISPHGYNLGIGGDIPIWSGESRAKLSASLKGKVRSEEFKANISRITKGRKRSDATCLKMSEAQKARDPSTRFNVGSLSFKGMPRSPEATAKTAAAHRGLKRSAEFKARMSAIAKNRIYSEETNKKRSETMKLRRAETPNWKTR